MVVTGGYCSLPVVAACYRLLLVVPTFSMYDQNMFFGWIFIMWYVFAIEISLAFTITVFACILWCSREKTMKTISFSSELLEPFLCCYFKKFFAGKILNNFCSSWTNCCNMIISFITKIAFLLSALISKMCTISTILPPVWILFGIPFLIRLLLNQHSLLLHF